MRGASAALKVPFKQEHRLSPSKSPRSSITLKISIHTSFGRSDPLKEVYIAAKAEAMTATDD
jgi:hypothetical protein